MSASNYMENKWLDHVFGNTPYSAPATIYIGLHTADPTETGATAEVSGNSYARASLTNNTTNFPNASGGSKSTGGVANYPTPSGNWGDINYFSFWDAASGGNCLSISDVISPAKTIQTGDTVSFASGAITVTAN